jgi:hypothetical protein
MPMTNATEALRIGGGRGVEIRGRAELFAKAEPRMDGSTDDRIRLHPHRILARNLDAKAWTPAP